MSRAQGERIVAEFPGLELNFQPAIKWNRTKKVFVLKVPDMYEITRLKKKTDINYTETEIDESDLWRLINADRGTKYGFWFDFKEERDELDDDTYLGISYVQFVYYLSINSLNEARHSSKRCGYPQWLALKKRTRRGGRPVGGGKSRTFQNLPESERERILLLQQNYDKIVINCYKKDWVTEYIELQRDICLLNGKKFPGKKQTIATFTAERKKWLEENS